MKKQKIIYLVVGILIGLIVGGAAGFGIGYAKYHTADTPADNESRTVTLEGKVICLPHRDQDGPHTLECAAGLQTTDGKNYSISMPSSDTSLAGAAGSDKKVRINGILQEKADTKYQSEGILTVDTFEFIN